MKCFELGRENIKLGINCSLFYAESGDSDSGFFGAPQRFKQPILTPSLQRHWATATAAIDAQKIKRNLTNSN